jgi:hypothetical protein
MTPMMTISIERIWDHGETSVRELIERAEAALEGH